MGKARRENGLKQCAMPLAYLPPIPAMIPGIRKGKANKLNNNNNNNKLEFFLNREEKRGKKVVPLT